MDPEPMPSQNNSKPIIARPHLWIVIVLLVVTTMIHYLTPPTRLLSPSIGALLNRHAVERILFLLPVVVATYAFRLRGGLLTLIAIILVMIPRAIWLSFSPADAIIETVAATVVGSFAIWMIEAQIREKELHQKTALRLSAINTVTAIVTSSLELEEILNAALDQVLKVMHLEMGLIVILDKSSQTLQRIATQGVPEQSSAELAWLAPNNDIYDQITQSGKPMVVQDDSQDLVAVEKHNPRTKIIAPIKSRHRDQGVLVVATRSQRAFSPEELELLVAIGSEIGVAVENAQLHRDVAWQLRTQQRLTRIAQEITSQLELDRILPQVLKIAKELVSADSGGIALFDRDKACIHYPYLDNLPQELANVSIPQGRGVAGKVMATGRAIIIKSYQDYPEALPAFVKAGLTSVVAVPITSGDHAFGALTLGCTKRTKCFSETDVTLLTGIGHQAGIAIENAQLYERMRFYARQIIQAQEDERERIARELHDETIQMLIVISRRLELLAATLQELPPDARQLLDSLQDLIRNTQKGVRLFAQGLRPPTLDHLGFVAAIRGLASALDKNGLDAEFKVSGQVRRLLPEEELVLFRIAQEAVNNVRRHAHASQVVIQLVFCPDRMQMSIQDNGCGFPPPGRMDDLVSTGKLGLIGMNERARTWGGKLDIQSAPSQGTLITVEMPVRPRPEKTTGAK